MVKKVLGVIYIITKECLQQRPRLHPLVCNLVSAISPFNFHKILHKRTLSKKVKSKHKFHKFRLSQSHTFLSSLHEFLTVLSIRVEQF